MPLLNEAMHVLMEGVASADDIDKAMKLGFGFNVGPLTLADMMGLDVVMSWMGNLVNELFEPKYSPCPILRKLVRAGHLGVKTGSGFFRYDAEGNKIAEADRVSETVITAELDLDFTRWVRHAYGFFNHRRPEAYGSLMTYAG